MEDFSNHTPSYYDTTVINVQMVLCSLNFIVTFPLICISIYGLCNHVRSYTMSVLVISIFLSDLVQISANLTFFAVLKHDLSVNLAKVANIIFAVAFVINISFMVCISAERYTMVAHPVWYRNFHKIKMSVMITLAIWITMSTVVIIVFLCGYLSHFMLFILLLPYPLVVIFFFKTRQALSTNVSLSPNDQRRIMGILASVLCIYTFLFLPIITVQIDIFADFLQSYTFWRYLVLFAEILMSLCPIFDLLLYVFMRRDVKDVFSTLVYCFPKTQDQKESEETSITARETQ